MIALDRRGLIRCGAASAMVAGVSLLVPHGLAAAGRRFAPPADPLIYSRLLVRQLAGGRQMAVARDFRILFAAISGGYAVDGAQVAVRVEAPPALDRFAALERERIETGLFPLHLDADGQIAGGQPFAGTPASAAILENAVATARAMTANLPGDQDQARNDAFIAAVHQSASAFVSQLPVDLFAPRALDRAESRVLALPDGVSGTVATRFVASIDDTTGLMREARRSVVTTIGAEARETVESWTLRPE